ncbi:MAG: hypothetical protein ACSHX6_16835 [Akkermansiaceae bacterium]
MLLGICFFSCVPVDFVVVIEEVEKGVDLERDPRHEKITRVVDTEIGERSFSNCNMDTFHLESEQTISLEAIAEYEKAFSTLRVMDTWIFIETLNQYTGRTVSRESVPELNNATCAFASCACVQEMASSDLATAGISWQARPAMLIRQLVVP